MHETRYGVGIVLSLSLTAASCVPATHADYEEPFRTDQGVYELSGKGFLSTTLLVTHTNRTGMVIYKPHHDCPTYERLTGGEWQESDDDLECAGVLEWPPLALRPGEEWSDTVNFVIRDEPERLAAAVPGTYRLVYELYEGYSLRPAEFHSPLEKEQRVSNPFEIVQ